MEIIFTDHSKLRMEKYNFTEEDVKNTIENPSRISEGHSNRTLF